MRGTRVKRIIKSNIWYIHQIFLPYKETEVCGMTEFFSKHNYLNEDDIAYLRGLTDGCKSDKEHYKYTSVIENEDEIIAIDSIQSNGDNWIFFLDSCYIDYYVMEFDIRIHSVFQEVQIVFNWQDVFNRYGVMLTDNHHVVARIIKDNIFIEQIRSKKCHLSMEEWHHFEFVHKRNRYILRIDGVKYISFKDFLNLAGCGKTGLIFFDGYTNKRICLDVRRFKIKKMVRGGVKTSPTNCFHSKQYNILAIYFPYYNNKTVSYLLKMGVMA